GEVVEARHGVKRGIGHPSDRVVLNRDAGRPRPRREGQQNDLRHAQPDRAVTGRADDGQGIYETEKDEHNRAPAGGARDCGARLHGDGLDREVRRRHERHAVLRIADDRHDLPRRARLLERVAAPRRQHDGREEDSSHSVLSTRSQYTNRPSRTTICPRRTASGWAKIGPPYTNVWNSPFSPHGSTPRGRSASSAASNSRPANSAARARESTHARIAL